VTQAGWLLTSCLMASVAGARGQEIQPAVREAAAPEKSWSLDLAFDYSSLYLFRGVSLLGDRGVLASNATLEVGEWSFYGWGNFGKRDALEGGGRYREIDLGLDYTFQAGVVGLTLGGLGYFYDAKVEAGLGFRDSAEIYAIASWEVPAHPFVSYNHDIAAYDGGYLTAGVVHSIPLGEKLAFDLSAAVGLDFGFNDVHTNGELNDLLLGVDLPWQVSERFSLHAQVQRSIALEVLENIGVDDETVFTVGGGYTF